MSGMDAALTRGVFGHLAGTQKLSGRYQWLKGLRDDCYGILFAHTEDEAQDRLMMHHRVAGLPRTTNIIENVNKQLERRIKTIEAFQHQSTASSYMNLLVAYLRQKPYTDCRGSRKRLNGKSRLQVAGVRHPADWLVRALKSSKISNR